MGASTEPTYSRKLTKLDGKLEWSKPAVQLEREIRAYAGWPKSYANVNGIDCVITKARIINESGTPGTLKVLDKNLVVFCKEAALVIELLKPAGKKEMSGQAYLAGHPLK